MALPSTPPITMAQIRTEYGLSGPLSLRAFIGKPGFPTSGAISMSNFLGKSGGGGALAMFVSGSPTGIRVGAGLVTTGTATGTATGGTPGYTYAWTRVSGHTFTINSPTSASTTFQTTLAADTFASGVYRCTVTDSLSATAFGDIEVFAEASP